MSKPINAPQRGANLPFNSHDFVSPRVAEEYPLGNVLDALASDDPERVAGAADDLITSANQVASMLAIIGEATNLQAHAGERADSPASMFASKEEFAAAANMLAGLVSLHANMMSVVVDATRIAAERGR